MGRELLWRGYPTDQRGTCFRRFWDRKRAPSDPTGDDIPQIAELDCNPFVVHETGATILDARIRVTAVEPRPLVGVRR